MSSIYVAIAIDKNYVQHAGVMLCSLFKNNPDSRFRVYLFCRGIEETALGLLVSLVEEYQSTLEVVEVGDPSVRFKVDGHITEASYFRLFIPTLVAAHVRKIIYLDVDIIVRGSILPLWNTDIKHHYLGAVENVTPREKIVLQGRGKYHYFNAGVLLINLEKWRKNQIMEQSFAFMKQHPDKIVFHDQDVLNAVLYGKWLPLHPKYNMQGALFMDEFSFFRGDPPQLKEAINDPIIIHYSTPLKPWHYLSFHPYTREYYKYLADTPWKNYRPTDRNLVRVARKMIRPYLRSVGIRKLFGKALY